MTHTPDIWPDFDKDFWPAYERKGSKMLSRKEWDKLSQKDREAAMMRVVDYVASTPEKKYRLDGERYLKRRKWEDEFVADEPAKAGTRFSEKGRSLHEVIARKYAGASGDDTPSY